MEWLALFVWLLVLMTALPLAAGALVRPEFGLAGMLSPLGFVGVLLFIILGGTWLLWVAVGIGVVSFLAVAVGSYGIVAGTTTRSSNAALYLEEWSGLLSAAMLFLLFYAIVPTIAAAAGATAA